MTIRVFTARSIGIGLAGGVLAGLWVGWVYGAGVVLAALNGLAGGVVAWTAYVYMSDGRFQETPRRWGVRILGASTLLPLFFVERIIGDAVSSAQGNAIWLLFLLTWWASYNVGGILATLEHLDGPEHYEPDPRLRLFP